MQTYLVSLGLGVLVGIVYGVFPSRRLHRQLSPS